mmetsp:Transcript_10551/g.23847  ORF Transcript_10551/g.23847 Transcript_10551/m.23847 type:complete len:233 (-) Transcript_10551:131-829(-)
MALCTSRTSVLSGSSSKARRSSSMKVRAAADPPSWLPGDKKYGVPKPQLAGLPGNYGFDPFNLSEDPETLKRFVVAEVLHARFAMLGVSGAVAQEIATGASWAEAPKAFMEGKGIYPAVVTDPGAIAAIQVVLMAYIEQKRADAEGEGNVYPGGAFDPLGYAKKGGEELRTLKVKEIANGRVAMLAFVGIQAQYQATGKGALECLSSHIASPFSVNAVTNGVSVPAMPVSFV